jgi:Fe-S cluster assembly protein SufD
VTGRADAAGEPDWLRDRRLQAFKTWRDQRWPDRKQDEYWRNTPFARLVDVERPLLDLDTPREDEVWPPSVVDDLDTAAATATVVDGVVVETTVPAELAAAGVVVTSLREAAETHAELVRTHLGSLTTTGGGTGADEDRTISANDAAWDAGVFVYVPPEVEASAPIGVHLHVTRPGAHLPRVLVVAGHHSKARVYLHHTSDGLSPEDARTASKTPAVVDEVVEVVAEDGAAVDVVNLDEHGPHVTLLALQKAALHRDATYRHVSVNIGGRTTRLRPEVDLVGAGASCFPIGIYFADEGQHFDVQPYIRHIAPRATSDVLYKGALQGHSRTVFRGNVMVGKDAVGTDTNETNRTLILTDGARADSTPFLEILCSDIQASHGSATGQIDASHLFYLEARGIPRARALRLIVMGFFREVLERFEVPGVEERAMAHIEREIDLTDIDHIATSQAAPLASDELV